MKLNLPTKIKVKIFFFYHCNKRPHCKGKAQFNKKDLSFKITEKCNNIEVHNKQNYIKFKELIEDNKSNLIDFNIKKINLI